MTHYKVIFFRVEEDGEEVAEPKTYMLNASTLDEAEDEARAFRPPGATRAKISDEVLVRRTLEFDFDA